MAQRTQARPPIGGIAVVLVAIVSLAVVVVAQPACGRSSAAPWGDSGPRPMELQGDWLGLTLTSPSSMAAQQLGLPGDAPGVAVTKISPEGSPAAAVGVTVGDVIVGVSGKPVSNLSGLYTLTTELASAQPLTLDVMRRGQPVTVVIQPNAMPMAGMATMQPGSMQPGSMQPGSMQPGSMQPGSMQPGSMQGVAAPWTGQPVAAMPPTVPAFPMAGPNPIPQSTW